MGGWVYIVTNRKLGTLYTGVTSDLSNELGSIALALSMASRSDTR